MIELSDRFKDALQYAVDLHKKQSRKGTDIPYVAHLLAVAATVLENGGDEEQAIAGLLHDSVEDQGGIPRLDEIRAKYGDRVQPAQHLHPGRNGQNPCRAKADGGGPGI